MSVSEIWWAAIICSLVYLWRRRVNRMSECSRCFRVKKRKYLNRVLVGNMFWQYSYLRCKIEYPMISEIQNPCASGYEI